MQLNVLSLNAIVNSAKVNGCPLSMTFIDLCNVFGSVPHRMIAS